MSGGEDCTGARSRARAEARTENEAGCAYRYNGKVVADYYEVLEVSPKARASVIDKAYRALMRECHPDHGGDVKKAQLINEAYEILSEPASRARYDRENGLC